MNNIVRPPEAALLDEALKRRVPRLSVRKAAQAAGISEGWWRQITKGVQSRGTGSIAVVGPPETIARMALAVGVSADELKEAGREDAAAIMPALERQRSTVDLTAITDEDLAAEFLRRMKGAHRGMEDQTQSSAPAQGRQGQEVSGVEPAAQYADGGWGTFRGRGRPAGGEVGGVHRGDEGDEGRKPVVR